MARKGKVEAEFRGRYHRIIIYGDPKYVPTDEAALKAFNLEAKGAVREAVEDLHRAVKAQLRKNKFPPSAASGEPPAYGGGQLKVESKQQTLMSSFRRTRVTVSKTRVRGGIESYHSGAARLEYGWVDKNGIRTFPHPYLDPAAREVEPSVDNIMSRILTDV